MVVRSADVSAPQPTAVIAPKLPRLFFDIDVSGRRDFLAHCQLSKSMTPNGSNRRECWNGIFDATMHELTAESNILTILGC